MTDHCCAHPKCPGGSLCCCQGQPDPIERAEQPAHDAHRRTAATGDRYVVWPAVARAVFESIDTNQLADVLSTLTTCDGQPHASELHHRQARAVKNWLTGKDQQ